ncbi:chaplin family protein [Nocardiopsis sp. FIRDI 009]|uniref:chaplin family protein n=1 Tax=Nocardiopsis sp. FIRDI 009 TaxID=714197 RepID=UPI000E220AC4|nr:chaplin family protein [Nocardiopsis sp. FIRDI 009]
MTHATASRVAALVAAGFLTATGGAAHADTTTSGNGSIGGGNQVGADIDVPVNVCGNAVAVVGVAGAGCVDGDAVVHDGYGGESGSPATPGDRRPDDSHDGYYDDGETPDDNPREDSPDESPSPAETASPSPEESPAPTEENRGESSEGEEGAPPQERPGTPVSEGSAPPGDDTELAVTGADATGVLWMVVAALATAAAGAGLILMGLRRRARA